MGDTMTLLLFGQLAEKCGAHSLELPAQVSLQGVRLYLEAHHPEIMHLPFRFAVNHRVADDDMLLPPGAVIALLPPFSGG